MYIGRTPNAIVISNIDFARPNIVMSQHSIMLLNSRIKSPPIFQNELLKYKYLNNIYRLSEAINNISLNNVNS